jgi:hypothetical protein
VPVNVAVEEPWASVVGHEADGHVVASTAGADDVTAGRVDEVGSGLAGTLDNGEGVTVKVCQGKRYQDNVRCEQKELGSRTEGVGTTDGCDVSLGKGDLDDPVLWELDDVIGRHEACRRHTVEDLKESGHIRGRVRSTINGELAVDELEVEVDLEDIRSVEAGSAGSCCVG